MATNTVGSRTTTATKTISPMDIARAILAPLASLKLTVFLLVLSVIVTFIATLDQTRADVYQVKMKHFENLMVEVPFQTFFVPRWAPSYQNVPGSFYIPSGITILVLMLMNLSAAHLLRFRLQAKGGKLIAGIVAAIFAGLLTWAVIFNGQNADGFQAQPPFSWRQMWTLMQIGLLGLSIAAAFGWFSLNKARKTERILLATATLIFGATLILTLFLREKAFIGDSAMRILWQLTQATMAALVSFVACSLLFNRKAGIVLLHLGVAGLMFNEIYVTTTNDEQRMTIFEGETVSQAIDIRATEMAIIDTTDPEFDEIVVVPGSKLQLGGMISSDELPFDIQCISYTNNSDLSRRSSLSNEQVATAGMGMRLKVVELPPTAGTDSDQVADIASAYVKFTSKPDGNDLGTHLISQHIEEHDSDVVTVGDKSYRVALRFKTAYKPYSLKLIDAQREDYLGTDTPRWYSSDIILSDFNNNIKSEQKIWMNNPLRYSDETFYQSGMTTLPDGRELSILQIVRNKGWMIPYVCCMFTVVGLIAQFGGTLLGFMEKSRKKGSQLLQKTAGSMTVNPYENNPPQSQLAEPDKKSAQLESTNRPWRNWIPTLCLIGIMAFWIAGEVKRNRSGQVANEMRLDLFGQIPVTINGRVQPLDSFARNTARQLGKRETVPDGNDKKQPAIRWLADTMFEADGYLDYRVFRIEDLNILGALELEAAFPKPRGKFRYTLAEMLDAEPTLRELIPDSDKQDPDTWSVFQKRLSLVATKMQRLYGVKLAFGGPDRSDQSLMLRIEEAGRSISSPLIPLVVPTKDEKAPWISFMTFKNQAWLAELSKQYNVSTTAALGQSIITKKVIPSMKEEAIRSQIIQRFLSDPEFVKVMEDQYGESDRRALAQLLRQNWDTFPAEIKSTMTAREEPLVDAMFAQQMPKLEATMEKMLATINGSSGDIKGNDSELANLLLELQPAYLDSDAEKFNSTLESYLAKVCAEPPEGLSALKLSTEKTYNSFSPFYVASVIYLASLLAVVLGWIGWQRSWNKAAYWLLMMALGIHVAGIIARVVISGRPPVTNLYSSVLFVSAAQVVIMLIIERITKLGIGTLMASLGAFLALLWAWTMTIVDGDTFTVMVAVLDTQFWLSTHVVCISIGYSATFVAGLLGLAYLIALLLTPKFSTKEKRRAFSNVIYGTVCFGLLCSFFGTVLGGLWGDDSWGRFWGWDPKENGALMIVLWNAVVLHTRWGGMVRDRGLAALAVLGNVVVLWSWKGVNSMGVGLHAYSGSEDNTVEKMMMVGLAHVFVAGLVIIPARFWMSYAKDESLKASS